MTADLTSLHITIAAGSIEGGSLDLSHETRLVKAALLYADRVTLASPKVMIVASMAGVTVGDLEQRRAAMLGMLDVLPDGAAIRPVYEALRRTKRKTKSQLLVYRQLIERLDKGAGEVVGKIQSLLEDAGAGELDEALKAGVVDLNPLGLNEPGGSVDNLILRLADLLAEVVAPSSRTYPMFDDTTGGLLAAMMREGKVPGAQLGYATQAALASRFVGQLDAFPDAPMGAVLEARDLLRAPLIGFRAAMTEMEHDMEATPLDENFERVVQDMYRKRVAPALQELEDIAKQLRMKSLLGRDLLTGGGRRVTEAAVSFAAATVAELPGLVASALGAGADLAASVYRRRLELKERQKENRFLFLYEAGKRLRR
jgi:hypothetical protein